MPKSKPSCRSGQRRGTVTVIEQPVMRSFMRKAKIVFWIVWVAVGLLAAIVLASKWEPKFGATGAGILALITGGLDRPDPGVRHRRPRRGVAGLRVIWWWLPELSLTGGLVAGWVELASHTDLVRPPPAHRRPRRRSPRLSGRSGAASTAWPGARSAGTASGPASTSSSSPTGPAASR